MNTTVEQDTRVIEYALMVDWNDGKPPEHIPAEGFDHAERMARTVYSAQSCWTVGREVHPWRYVRRSDAELTDEVAR